MGLRSRVRELEGEAEELSREVGRLRLVSARADGAVDAVNTRLQELTTAVWAVFRRGKAGGLEDLMVKLEGL